MNKLKTSFFVQVKTPFFSSFRQPIIAIFILFFSSCTDSSVDIASIKKLIQEGELVQAESQIQKAIEGDSANVDLNILYADLLLKKGEYRASYFYLCKAHEADSINIDVNLKISQFHLFLRQFDNAIQAANAVLKVDRSNAKAYFLKGMAYKDFGDTVKAFSNFRTAVEQDDKNYESYVQLGILASAKHDSTAVHYFDNALLLKPNEPEVLYNKALFYHQHGAVNKAMKIYLTVPEGSSFYGSARYNIASILYHQEDFKHALQFFDIASKYNSYKAFYMKGLIYERTGKVDSAMINYKQCLSINPEYKLAQERMTLIR